MIPIQQSAILSGLWVTSAAITDTGKVRQLNEDAVLNRPEAGIWAVADGMGGHQRGDTASRAIAETLARVPALPGASALMAQVRAGLETVNHQLVAERQSPSEIIASTLVCLLIAEGYFACIWAGDSRLYLLRDGALSQISTDHSVVQQLLDSGAITADQATTHPRGNEVTRAIGVHPELPVEIRQGRVLPHDQFLLCSDGLFRVVTEWEIAAQLTGSPATVVANLMALALARGAPDNVSIVVVRCQPEPDTHLDKTQIIARIPVVAG
ncbi:MULTISPECIES: PP2C family serine/threonine-protein phosphatase [unclassified Azospirillum]|uniref:PP2C family protein-serine/threonine phosphatase n=1 Tax=unclassified Azospirillum TaxID=2630922 RepID=UPI000B685FE8|nr:MULTISPECIES: protein phosphatase 2C domain-containing protein [unclassified Azospirillum]SNS92155.1 serine/threonine protein phosphatase Stp1 [Azospirillum sp. RU38E]SNT09117.1 serine/threonine protein phosphatase Stp1 [Azospirillum sp. RU37A]